MQAQLTCPNCGSANNPGRVLCAQCGKPMLAALATDRQPGVSRAAIPVQPAQPNQQAALQPAPQSQYPPAYAPLPQAQPAPHAQQQAPPPYASGQAPVQVVPGQYPYQQQAPQYGPYAQTPYPHPQVRVVSPSGRTRVTAALFAILLGGLGAHKFYLGQPGFGLLYLMFCCTGIPSIVGVIEGIIYLGMGDQEFVMKYG